MRPHLIFTSVIVLISCVYAFSQPDQVTITNAPGWITSIDFDVNAQPSESQKSSYYYLLIDEQENTISEEEYHHYAYRILTNDGIQEMSDLSFDFDPSYQELKFHEVKIIRGSETIDRLSKDIQVIQREQSMDRFLYDGTKTAIINLKDIRVGDVIEYAFTKKGYNPVHDGHVARSIYYDYYSATAKFFKEIIFSASRPVFVKGFGPDELKISKNQTGSLVRYTISAVNKPAKIFDSNTPVWFDNTNYFLISDFKSWEEVGEWAKKLFLVSDVDREKIKAESARLFNQEDEHSYALAVIRFVQDQVRYLGFENGINSHKPNSPVKILDQRFGDCKDKSLLLSTLLQSRNIEAYPVLVNTSLKNKIEERLPAGNVFDHCVVKIILDGKEIFVDPTINDQGGTLEQYYFPDYSRGLVVDNDIENLDSLPKSLATSISEEQTLELLTIGGEAMFTIATTYTGGDADNQRSQFANSSLEEIQKNYLKFYANLYPDIVVWEPLSFSDERDQNTFKVYEKYKIPSFWKPVPNEEHKIFCEFYPQSMSSYFDIPKSIQQRTTPYYLSYPVNYYHTLTVKLPQEWEIVPQDEVIENDFYEYEYSVRKRDYQIIRYTRYKTKQDHIPFDKITDFIGDHARMWNNLSYQLTYDKGIEAAGNNTIPGIIVTIITIAGGVFLMFALYHRYNPVPELNRIHGQPIGGWLILMALGVVITPLRLFYDLAMEPDLITGKGWMTWLAAKNYGLFAFTIFTHIYNILKLLFSTLLVALFFQRRSSFPKLMIVQLALGAVTISADTFISRSIVDNPSQISAKEAIQACVGAAIWIPYLINSYRVRETFVIRIDDDDDPSAGNVDVTVHENADATLN